MCVCVCGWVGVCIHVVACLGVGVYNVKTPGRNDLKLGTTVSPSIDFGFKKARIGVRVSISTLSTMTCLFNFPRPFTFTYFICF